MVKDIEAWRKRGRYSKEALAPAPCLTGFLNATLNPISERNDLALEIMDSLLLNSRIPECSAIFHQLGIVRGDQWRNRSALNRAVIFGNSFVTKSN